jgi:hypothetical protein
MPFKASFKPYLDYAFQRQWLLYGPTCFTYKNSLFSHSIYIYIYTHTHTHTLSIWLRPINFLSTLIAWFFYRKNAVFYGVRSEPLRMDGKVTCRWFKFIIAQDGWNRGKKISVGYMIKFMWPTFGSLQTFGDGRLCTVVRRILSFVSFRPYVCKCYGGKWSTAAVFSQEVRQDGRQRWNLNTILYVLPEGYNYLV